MQDTDESKIESLRQVVTEGDSVYVKVLSTHDENTGELKIACSMKLVRQSDGHDLDPTNLQVQRESNRGAGGARGGPVSGSIDDPLWMMKQRGSNNNGYDLLEDSDDDLPKANPNAGGVAPAPGRIPPPPPPAGRGRGMTMPAWMTRDQDDSAIGKLPGGDDGETEEPSRLAGLPQKVTTKEEALMVLESLLGKSKKEDKHKKKHKDKDKEKKHKKEKHKKEKKHSH